MATNRRGQATRERLLEATLAVLEAQGLTFTIDDVAAAAGVARPTVHRHFATRDELVATAVLRRSRVLAEQLTEILGSDAPFEDRLTESMVAMVAALSRAKYVFAIDADDRVAGPVLGTVKAFFRPWLDDAQASGVSFRQPVDVTLEWLLRQTLLMVQVPSSEGTGDEAVRREVRRFVVPAVLATTSAGCEDQAPSRK